MKAFLFILSDVDDPWDARRSLDVPWAYLHRDGMCYVSPTIEVGNILSNGIF